MDPAKPAHPDDAAPLRFEEALARLEAVVHRLEEGELPLDESLAEYKEGVELLRWCHRELAEAERQIDLLLAVDEAGQPVTREFVECDDENDAPAPPRRRRSRRRAKPPPQAPPAEDPDGMDDEGGLF